MEPFVYTNRAHLIEAVSNALIQTSRTIRFRQGKHSDPLLKIRRGFYLPTSFVTQTKNRIERRLIIFIAQCIATCRLSPECVALTHEAALVFLDIPILNLPYEIRMSYRERRWRLRATFPAVHVDGVMVSPPRVARFHKESTGQEWQYCHGVRLAPSATVMMDLALQGCQRSAFASACLMLRGLTTHFTRRFDDVEANAQPILSQLLEELDSKRARTPLSVGRGFLSSLKPQVESIPEAALVWDLYAHCDPSWALQYSIDSYRADVCFPSQRIILEVEGSSKLGRTDPERQRSAASLINRSSFLSQQGFSVLAVSASDVMNNALGVMTFLRSYAPSIFSNRRAPRWCRLSELC